MTHISRRGFLAAGASALMFSQFPGRAVARPAALSLTAGTRTIEVMGRAATVLGLEGPSGQGLMLDPGQPFRVDLHNRLTMPTLIHWHGQLPPNAQDGVPDLPAPMLPPDQTRSYDFTAQPGTHWMHAHVPAQEIQLLSAPLIVRAPDEAAEDRQEVVMFLQDFSFKSPDTVLDEITGGGAHAGAMDHGAMHGAGHMAMGQMQDMTDMSGRVMDLNDYDWDAYLANDRTLEDPQVVQVERSGRVRLRIINAATATVFWIDTGDLPARLVAVDGHAVAPLSGRRFGIAMGQRLDLLLELPGGGAWPILALREGARERTGLILATPGARPGRPDLLSRAAPPAFDLAQEARLVALDPLPERPAERTHMVMLGGAMQPYRWTIDGTVWGEHQPIRARSGERVEITLHNMSMMAHAMHLHGHVFQVVNLNGKALAGARRDTIHVPPMSMVTVALNAREAARWMLHCHHIPHLATGMMTEFLVTA